MAVGTNQNRILLFDWSARKWLDGALTTPSATTSALLMCGRYLVAGGSDALLTAFEGRPLLCARSGASDAERAAETKQKQVADENYLCNEQLVQMLMDLESCNASRRTALHPTFLFCRRLTFVWLRCFSSLFFCSAARQI